MEIILNLSKQEAEVLLNLVNIAVQVKGLEAAEAGVFFQKKINEAAKVAHEKSELKTVD